MAFPTVRARQTSVSATSNTTSFTPTLSAHSAGELLVVVVSSDGNPTLSTTSNGWAKLGQASNGSIVTGAVFWKLAASASESLVVNATAAEQYSAISHTIRGAVALTGTSASGSSTNSNPPNHTHGDGLIDLLWLVTRSGDSTTVASVAPANYTNLQTIAGGGTAGASTNSADRSLNAASDDPGTFTSSNEQWVTWTLAIRGTLPSTAALSLAGTVGVLALAMGLGASTLSFAGQAPSVGIDQPLEISPAVLRFAGPQANPQPPLTISPDAGALSLAGPVPLPTVGPVLNVPSGTLQLLGPRRQSSFSPTSASAQLSLVGYSPVSINTGSPVLTPGVGTLTFAGHVPGSGAGEHFEILVSEQDLFFTGQYVATSFGGLMPAVLVLAGLEPTVSITGTTAIAPGVGGLALTGTSAVLAQSVVLPVGVVSATGQSPVVVQATASSPAPAAVVLSGQGLALHLGVSPGAAVLAIGGPVPTLLGAGGVAPDVGTLTVSGLAPSLVTAEVIGPGVGSVSFAGHVPGLAWSIGPAVGTLAFASVAPTLVGAGGVSPSTGVLSLIGLAPSVGATVGMPVAATVLSGQAPVVLVGLSIAVGSTALAVDGQLPTMTVVGDLAMSPGVGELALTGAAPSFQLVIATPTRTVHGRPVVRIVQARRR